MSIQELDRNYLAERCSILNAFFDEIISLDVARVDLDMLDFKFETLIDLERMPCLTSE